jgi:hypothetical protein
LNEEVNEKGLIIIGVIFIDIIDNKNKIEQDATKNSDDKRAVDFNKS